MKFTAKHISFFYLFALFTGTLCFIPAIFVNRFTTTPALWMQAGLSPPSTFESRSNGFIAHYMNEQADYDLQILVADNCLQMQQFRQTENHLIKAEIMCPVKFMPLYRLTELYLETGRKEDAKILAQKILDKKVKIPSPIINSIKNKIRNLLNEPDSLNNSSQLINHDMKPATTSAWQDCLLDFRIPRALLPT